MLFYIIYLAISYFLLYICAFKIYIECITDDNRVIELKLFEFPIIVWIIFAIITILPPFSFGVFWFLFGYYFFSDRIESITNEYEYKIIVKNKLFHSL